MPAVYFLPVRAKLNGNSKKKRHLLVESHYIKMLRNRYCTTGKLFLCYEIGRIAKRVGPFNYTSQCTFLAIYGMGILVSEGDIVREDTKKNTFVTFYSTDIENEIITLDVFSSKITIKQAHLATYRYLRSLTLNLRVF